MMPTLLIVDDEPNIVFSLKDCLSSPKLKVISASAAKDGIELVRTNQPDVVILDVQLPEMSGLEAYDRMRQIDSRLPVIMITAYARTETAIEAMRRGAYDYLLKPLDVRRLRDTVGRALKVSHMSRVPAVVDKEAPADLSADRIVGQSSAMQEVYKTIGRVAPQDATVLILGESGTGKELVARAIYHYSRRNTRPFLVINCAALPEALLESELFGHERGAFTGADKRRVGKFEQVNGGTIFLDEIGDMSPATQAKALRLLQQQQFERIGGNQTVTTDVRVIAATNKNLPAMVAEGTFRQDLYYRLSGFTIGLPALRDRKEDLPLMCDHFVKVYNSELGKHVHSVTAETQAVLEAHSWPGNVREFQNAIKYAMVNANGDVLSPECLPDSCRAGATDLRIGLPTLPAATDAAFDLVQFVRQLMLDERPEIYRQVCAAVDRVVLDEVLQQCSGHQQQAAERLGMSRTTLRSKLRALGLSPERPAVDPL